MKTKPTAKSKKPKVKVRDMKPRKDAKGGRFTDIKDGSSNTVP
jgi:hypothetical protein